MPIFIGTRSSIANYTREEATRNFQLRKLPVFIASATSQHLEDIRWCAELTPSEIYIEKGFSSEEERSIASEIVSDVNDSYIMSQYRYMNILEVTKPYLKNIKSIRYNWTIENSSVSEYIYHIASLDGYIKNKRIPFYNSEYGTFTIDDISEVTIQKGVQRRLTININTESHNIDIIVDKFNSVNVRNLRNVVVNRMTTTGEDILGKMIFDIIRKNNLKLERL